MALTIGAVEKAATIRELARELLAKADGLDGEMPCECGHTRTSHDPAGWNEGWCDGARVALGHEASGPNDCKCEEFTAW
jgi:hypothetical protein